MMSNTRYVALVAVIAVASVSPTALAAERGTAGHDLVCAKADGMIEGPYIRTADAAKVVFKVVSQSIDVPHKAKYEFINAEDLGKSWSVAGWEHKPQSVPPPAGFEAVEITSGGGGLVLEIDKCTGAITKAYFAK